MNSHGLGAEEQVLRDLGIRQPAGKQRQYLALTGRQLTGIRIAPSAAVEPHAGTAGEVCRFGSEGSRAQLSRPDNDIVERLPRQNAVLGRKRRFGLPQARMNEVVRSVAPRPRRPRRPSTKSTVSLLAVCAATATIGVGLVSAGAGPVPSDLQAVRGQLARYHSVAQVAADGYVAGSPCDAQPAGGMGIHYVNPSLLGAPVDPSRPAILLYEPDSAGALKLVGVEYFAVDADQNLATDADRPNLFGQAFDGRWLATIRRCRCTMTCTCGYTKPIRTASSRSGMRRSPAPERLLTTRSTVACPGRRPRGGAPVARPVRIREPAFQASGPERCAPLRGTGSVTRSVMRSRAAARPSDEPRPPGDRVPHWVLQRRGDLRRSPASIGRQLLLLERAGARRRATI